MATFHFDYPDVHYIVTRAYIYSSICYMKLFAILGFLVCWLLLLPSSTHAGFTFATLTKPKPSKHQSTTQARTKKSMEASAKKRREDSKDRSDDRVKKSNESRKKRSEERSEKQKKEREDRAEKRRKKREKDL